MIKNWKDKRNLVFSYTCLVGKIEKWRNKKLICLVEKKNEIIENVDCINLLLCP